MGVDLCWTSRPRDWRWLWLRRRTVFHSVPVDPVVMGEISWLEPGSAASVFDGAREERVSELRSVLAKRFG